MNYWKSQGAPAEKLIVGFPTYGNTFTLRSPSNHGVGAAVSGAGTPGKYTQEPGELAYFEVRFLHIFIKYKKLILNDDGGSVFIFVCMLYSRAGWSTQYNRLNIKKLI